MRRNIARLKARPRARLARIWVLEREDALNLGHDAVSEVAMTEGERGDDLRQILPLAGVLAFCRSNSVIVCFERHALRRSDVEHIIRAAGDANSSVSICSERFFGTSESR